MIDPFGAALVAASVLALWDYGRRWLQIRDTEASASRNYELTYQNVRSELSCQDNLMADIRGRLHKLESQRDKADLEDFRNLANKVSNHTMSIDAYHAAHEGLRAETERNLEGLRQYIHERVSGAITSCGQRMDEIEKRPKTDAETEAAIKELYARCDKNSTAIVNTAESMQKVLNEKFTALALSRGINQKG